MQKIRLAPSLQFQRQKKNCCPTVKGTVGAPVEGGDNMTEAAILPFAKQIENEIMIASAAKEKS
jgi:hypothetical protein